MARCFEYRSVAPFLCLIARGCVKASQRGRVECLAAARQTSPPVDSIVGHLFRLLGMSGNAGG